MRIGFDLMAGVFRGRRAEYSCQGLAWDALTLSDLKLFLVISIVLNVYAPYDKMLMLYLALITGCFERGVPSTI